MGGVWLEFALMAMAGFDLSAESGLAFLCHITTPSIMETKLLSWM